jgi:hypothetical protein
VFVGAKVNEQPPKTLSDKNSTPLNHCFVLCAVERWGGCPFVDNPLNALLFFQREPGSIWSLRMSQYSDCPAEEKTSSSCSDGNERRQHAHANFKVGHANIFLDGSAPLRLHNVTVVVTTATTIITVKVTRSPATAAC